MTRRGFLFTVTLLLILGYIIFSINLWVKKVEISERTFAEFYRESSLDLVAAQLSEEKVSSVVYILMRNALNELTLHTMENPVVPGEEDELSNVREALKELFLEGRASSEYFVGGRGATTPTSFNAWIETLNSSLNEIGLYIDDYEVRINSLDQISYDKVGFDVSVALTVKDGSGRAELKRTYRIKRNISVAGLIDPALYRESVRLGAEPIYRRFYFFDEYASPSSIRITKVADAVEGAGWIYGALALAQGESELIPNAGDVPAKNRPLYILVGTFDEITSLADYQNFGGFIIIGDVSRGTSLEDCDNQRDTFYPLEFVVEDGVCRVRDVGSPASLKPFAVVPDFNPENAPVCYFAPEGTERKCVLLNARTPLSALSDMPELKLMGGALYDMEKVRDAALCGYYIPSLPDENAPSFFQRLLNNSFSFSGGEFGLETFVIGRYAVGSEYDDYSSLDREMFRGIVGSAVRGMPGCKTEEQCREDSVIGVFRIDGSNPYGFVVNEEGG